MQMTIAVFMIALTLTQLFWGPFSDKFGRKKTLFIGLIISMLGSLICIFANNIEWLNFGRLIQGIGCGAAAGLFRAILRDMYTGRQLASIGSYFSNFLVFVLMLAPMLGGFIEKNYSWHLSFAFLIIWCFLSLVLVSFAFKEIKREKKETHYLEAYKRLLKSRVFMGCCLSNFLSFAGMFAWITSCSAL